MRVAGWSEQGATLDWIKEGLGKAVEAVREYGPVPVVAVVLGVAAAAALTAHANPVAVVIVVLACVIATIYAQERRAAWRRDHLRVEFDEMQRTFGSDVHRRLQRRIDERRRLEEPDLFDRIQREDEL